MDYDLVIIGAGPAGLTAALYAGRYRLKTAFLEKMSAGGQILLSPAIENYPGFPDGISTEELIARFKQQAEHVGITMVTEEVVSLEERSASGSKGYTVKTTEREYSTRCVVIASGAQPKRLGIEGEDQFTGRGVSYCGTCDGPLFRNRDVVVIGGGDRALEEALYLAEYAKRVTLIHRRNELRASKIIVEKARQNPKVGFIFESTVQAIRGEKRVGSVEVQHVKNGTLSSFSCEGVFIFVGITPHTSFAKGFVSTDEAGFIITDEDMHTSKEGIFACGDCRKKSLYQVVNACAEGALAAFSTHGYLLHT
jgi:thioredoxin reductase (NADPH)